MNPGKTHETAFTASAPPVTNTPLKKVMLVRDLAVLFDVMDIRLREQVRRNIQKFPLHFMFQLTNEEVEIMVSQNAVPSRQHPGGSAPFVFTEYGI